MSLLGRKLTQLRVLLKASRLDRGFQFFGRKAEH